MSGPTGYYRSEEMSSKKYIDLVHANWTKRLLTTSVHLLDSCSEQVRRCIEIALSCMDADRHKRPSIGVIISQLNETETPIQSSHMNKNLSAAEPMSMTFQELHRIKDGFSEIQSSHMNKNLSAAEPMSMTFQELHRITDGFSENRLLGKGGFGMVYKGVFDNGDVVAVKKLHNKPGIIEVQFKNELLNLMAVPHQNVVRLVGYCSEAKQILQEDQGEQQLINQEERALCLEYLPGGNLEELLSGKSCDLDWEERYRIIKGICEGLKHLHVGTKKHIYHLDLKPANILLDDNRIPKIGDFGLSRHLASTETFVTKSNSGTIGYMPPEYMHLRDNKYRQVSSKFDVYSLGVIMIEIIAGQDGLYNYKCLMSPKEFIDHVTTDWSKRLQGKSISSKSVQSQEVLKCIKMALRCVEDKQVNRPTITEVVKELCQ